MHLNQESTSRASWLGTATQGTVVARSLRVSLVVGSILITINHGDVLIGTGLTPDLVWKIPLTYMVPYAVSTYAAVDAILSRQVC